jgi:hypothetical protein
MTSKKLGALLRSVPPATARTDAPPPIPTAQSGPAFEAPPPAPLIESEVPLQVLVPRHIRKQLAVKAAQEGHSLRALVLTGIRSLGIEVTDEEIRDKRGRRGNRFMNL